MEATYFRRKNKINQLVKDLQLEVKSTYTPMETNYYNLQNEENLLPSNDKYRQAIGSLLYTLHAQDQILLLQLIF